MGLLYFLILEWILLLDFCAARWLAVATSTVTFGDRSGIPLRCSCWKRPTWCMLLSGRRYQPEMSEVAELLKAWKQEREEQHIEREEKRHYEQSRAKYNGRSSDICRPNSPHVWPSISWLRHNVLAIKRKVHARYRVKVVFRCTHLVVSPSILL